MDRQTYEQLDRIEEMLIVLCEKVLPLLDNQEAINKLKEETKITKEVS